MKLVETISGNLNVVDDHDNVDEYDTVLCEYVSVGLADALQALWNASLPVADQDPRWAREASAARAAFYAACQTIKRIV